MVPANTLDLTFDPVEMLNGMLERAWMALCNTYDVTACLPEIGVLFEQVNLAEPGTAAQSVLVNMLTEVIECIGRFSPWYKMPARAFGLISVRNSLKERAHWVLAPEALQKWRQVLAPLSAAIEKYSGLIQALILVDDLMQEEPFNDPCVIAHCQCEAPRTIQIKRSILERAEILCDECKQPFSVNP
jgi:hypothetical protein